jgi:hypothetical protein
LLVAVTVTTPALDGATNVADVSVTFVNVPHAFPVQPAPDALQFTPAAPTSFVTVTVTLSFCPSVNPPRFGEIVTLIFPTGMLVSVIAAAADFVPSLTDVAVSVTPAGVGTLAGAVYIIPTPDALAFAESVPHAAPVQPTPLSAQFTPLFCASFVTVALNPCVPPGAITVADAGATTTLITGGAVNVIVDAADFVPSLTDVAVSVTAAGVGTLAGAVYVIPTPEALAFAESVPHAVPLQPAPLSAQLTPLFCASFITVALNPCVPPGACTLAVFGETATAIAGGAVIVIVAAADLLVSATAVAVTITVAGEGTVPGAVNVIVAPEALAVLDSAPHAAPAHPAPDSAHVTPRFSGSFVTVALKLCCCPVCTLPDAGDTVAVTFGGGVIVNCADADFVASAAAIARIVTTACVGTVNGAVYVPFEIVPKVLFPPTTPFTSHTTFGFELFCTVALNTSVVPVCTEPLVIFSTTATCGGGPENGDDAHPPRTHAQTKPASDARLPARRRSFALLRVGIRVRNCVRSCVHVGVGIGEVSLSARNLPAHLAIVAGHCWGVAIAYRKYKSRLHAPLRTRFFGRVTITDRTDRSVYGPYGHDSGNQSCKQSRCPSHQHGRNLIRTINQPENRSEVCPACHSERFQ